MPSMDRDCLSEHDNAVLDSIFNPLQIGGGSEVSWNYDEGMPGELQDPIEEPLTPQIIESQDIEIEAVSMAENGDYEKALELFNKAINLAPKRPTLWNNRAQTYRLMGNEEAALSDLEEALKLSNSSGRTGCRALCQRGLLRRKNQNDNGAREDFDKAARMGSKFARTQLIEMNPYAALCNQMLRDVFQKLT